MYSRIQHYPINIIRNVFEIIILNRGRCLNPGVQKKAFAKWQNKTAGTQNLSEGDIRQNFIVIAAQL